MLKFKDKWDEITKKIGYWVDLENPYITFKNDYIETLWWCLKQLHEENLLYEDVSIQPYSPAAGTGLSSHELNQPGTYKDVKDTSAVVMFKAVNQSIVNSHWYKKINPNDLMTNDFYFLAWTTTPWTLPSNLGLTVGPDIDYVLIKTFSPYTWLPINVILARALLHKYFKPEDENPLMDTYKQGDKTIPWKVLTEFKEPILRDVITNSFCRSKQILSNKYNL